jgi:hypothetical protein
MKAISTTNNEFDGAARLDPGTPHKSLIPANVKAFTWA